MGTVTQFKVPDRVHIVDELCGIIKRIEVAHMVVLVEDETGVWSMVLDGTTAERMNWILDRAKLLLHRELTPS